jgi:hypothetical protein
MRTQWQFDAARVAGVEVMQIENNDDREEDELVAEFDGRLVGYPFGKLDERERATSRMRRPYTQGHHPTLNTETQ